MEVTLATWKNDPPGERFDEKRFAVEQPELYKQISGEQNRSSQIPCEDSERNKEGTLCPKMKQV